MLLPVRRDIEGTGVRFADFCRAHFRYVADFCTLVAAFVPRGPEFRSPISSSAGKFGESIAVVHTDAGMGRETLLLALITVVLYLTARSSSWSALQGFTIILSSGFTCDTAVWAHPRTISKMNWAKEPSQCSS